mgnify:FL=1
MSWLRIEDTVPLHPKHLKAGPEASWLWVCAIAYCQRQLTEGYIPVEALPLLGVPKNPTRLADRLVEVELFETAVGGYQVHDYLDFNASKDEALARREDLSRKRSESGRIGGLRSGAKRSKQAEANEANAEAKPKQVASSKPKQNEAPSHPSTDDVKNTSSAPPTKQIAERVGRLFLHRWQLEALIDALGPHAESFDLDVWIDGLTRKADAQGLTFPTKESRWTWVQSELKAEIERRGLPVAGATSAPSRPRGCKHEPACADDATHTKLDMAERRRAS